MTYENNLVGRVTKVGTYLSDYHFQKDDVYWKDFKFENGKKFICYNLTRYEDGTVAGETASGSIDFKKDTIKLNVTGTTIPNREWKRIK